MAASAGSAASRFSASASSTSAGGSAAELRQLLARRRARADARADHQRGHIGQLDLRDRVQHQLRVHGVEQRRGLRQESDVHAPGAKVLRGTRAKQRCAGHADAAADHGKRAEGALVGGMAPRGQCGGK
ncbi:hypothetical protein OR16_26773 [Cupriavidus basilensis OR16]|uniref:Uncharacterized protein n=1 Tax=Cupriavidus basilensis OR16 TaxID=1127483 RepID=H1SB26_9BURK|nr:hypothetical protein OR16_26773 [Cupriavidus basilensis OR16]